MNQLDVAVSSIFLVCIFQLLALRSGVVDPISDQCRNKVPKMIHEADGQGVDALQRNRASP
jgi:hypothetical protein